MIIREASAGDAQELKELYFEHLTKYPPKEEAGHGSMEGPA